MTRKSNSTLLEALNRASLFLQSHDLSAGDAQMYYMFYKDWSLTDLVTQLHQPILKSDEEAFQAILNRIVKDEPIQYILGYADFKGRRFKVTPDTLIPREETEGIIDIAVNYFKKNSPKNILDIGTGTGILAITLQLLYTQSLVYGVDICKQALMVANENKDQLNAQVNFYQSDLTENLPKNIAFDLIVSNPPYIGEHELANMDESVKQYEPKLALFADNDGFAIYQRIATQIKPFMADDCLMIFEIGWQQGKKVTQIFQAQMPDATIRLAQDFNGRDRYLIIEKGCKDKGGYYGSNTNISK